MNTEEHETLGGVTLVDDLERLVWASAFGSAHASEGSGKSIARAAINSLRHLRKQEELIARLRKEATPP